MCLLTQGGIVSAKKGGDLTTEKREKTIDLGTEEATHTLNPNNKSPDRRAGRRLSLEN